VLGSLYARTAGLSITPPALPLFHIQTYHPLRHGPECGLDAVGQVQLPALVAATEGSSRLWRLMASGSGCGMLPDCGPAEKRGFQFTSHSLCLLVLVDTLNSLGNG
jgi:hypothetical protein